MATMKSAFHGCLLGLAAGDAMGAPADRKSWREIRADYGPNGLLGYDLTGDSPRVTSNTQLCAFTCNGLLLGLTRERLRGGEAPYGRYMALSQKEWASAQRRYSTLRRTYCWVNGVEEFRSRRCGDSRMIDTLTQDRIGTPEEPVNRLDGPDSLCAAVAAGLFAPGRAMELGAAAVALTNGAPAAFLTGAIAANLTGKLLCQPQAPVLRLLEQTLREADAAYTRRYPQTVEIIRIVCRAVEMAREPGNRLAAMESLVCRNAPQVLAGAVYALLTCGDDFDTAMITAANHSGRSAAVAALTGALLGTRLGAEALPDFYLDYLESAADLRTLAEDLRLGCPVPVDLEWDRKYLQGER